jgi:hypothetical protein
MSYDELLAFRVPTFEEIVEDAGLNINSIRSNACLTRMTVLQGEYLTHGLVDIGIIENQNRAIAS